MGYEAKFHPAKTSAELAAEDPHIGQYEIAVASDTGEMKVGPGRWSELPAIKAPYTPGTAGAAAELEFATGDGLGGTNKVVLSAPAVGSLADDAVVELPSVAGVLALMGDLNTATEQLVRNDLLEREPATPSATLYFFCYDQGAIYKLNFDDLKTAILAP